MDSLDEVKLWELIYSWLQKTIGTLHRPPTRPLPPPDAPGYPYSVNDPNAVIDAVLRLLNVGSAAGAAASTHRDARRRSTAVLGTEVYPGI